MALTAAGGVELHPSGRYRLIEATQDFRGFGGGRVVGYGISEHGCRPQHVRAEGRYRRGRRIEEGAVARFDDLPFGALMIASGHMVVPALEWVSFHPRHEGRKATREVERTSSLSALRRAYLDYLDRDVADCVFPSRRFRVTWKSGNVEGLAVSGGRAAAETWPRACSSEPGPATRLPRSLAASEA